METSIRYLKYTFIVSLTLFLVCSFTSLKDYYLQIPFTDIQADVRHFIITAFVLISFTITFLKNLSTQFQDREALKILIGESGLLFLWLIILYYVRLASYAVASLFSIQYSTLPNIIDYIFYMLMLSVIAFIIFLIVRLRKINKGIKDTI
jgi:hypothetical protein